MDLRSKIKDLVDKTDYESQKEFAELIGAERYFGGHIKLDLEVETPLQKAYLEGKKKAKKHLENKNGLETAQNRRDG